MSLSALSRSVSRRLHVSSLRSFAASHSPVIPPSSSPTDRFAKSLNIPTKKHSIVSEEIPTENRVPISELIHPQDRRNVPSGLISTVFGGSGFVGRSAVHDLARMGSQIVIPFRGDGLKLRHLKVSGEVGQIVPIPFDLADEDSVRRCLARSNVVVNLLGSHVETVNYSYDDVHVKCTYRIAKLSRDAGVERFIHISALGADHNSPSAFLRSKAAGEDVVRQFFPDATILRPAPIVGAYDHLVTWIAYFGNKLVALPVANEGQQQIQPVMVEDVSRAIAAVIAREETLGRTYELGGRDVFTFENLIKLVGNASNRHYNIIKLPEPILRFYGQYLGGSNYPMLDNPNNSNLIHIRNFFVGIMNRLRFSWVYHEDLVDQAKVDLIVDPSKHGNNSQQIRTLEDLGIQPASIFDHIERLMIPYKDYTTLPLYRFNPNNYIHESKKGKRV